MKAPQKFASEISTEKEELPGTLMKRSPDARIRMRSHMILLSSEGYSIRELPHIFRVRRDTVSARIDAREKYGPDGLKDRDGSGCPPKLNASDTEAAAEIIGESPQNPRRIIARIQERLNIKISGSALKRTVKKN